MSLGAVDGETLAALASELADATRATICLTLLDGRAWTVTELAAVAGVARSTLSEHATRLVAAGLLTQQHQGRHRYLSLAGGDMAALVETLAAHAQPRSPPSSLRTVRTGEALAAGRTCYDHLAGRLGVGLLDALEACGHVTTRGGLALTPSGLAWLTDHGVHVDALRRARRPMVHSCLDWTERRDHLSGRVGAALLDIARREEWIVARAGSRAVALTEHGARLLRDEIGLEVAILVD